MELCHDNIKLKHKVTCINILIVIAAAEITIEANYTQSIETMATDQPTGAPN